MKQIFGRLSSITWVNIVLGLILLIWPSTSVRLLGRILGGALILIGLFLVVKTLISGVMDSFTLVCGGIIVLLGVVLGSIFPTLVSLIPVLFGIVIIISCLSRLTPAWEKHKAQGGNWLSIGIAVAGILVGIGIISNPFSTLSLTLRIIGLVLLIDGGSSAYAAWQDKKMRDKYGYVAKQGDDGIIDVVFTEDDK